MSSIPEFGRSPGKEMATHSSILALKIPWTEEPGGLPGMGFQRIRCYWTQRYTHTIRDSMPWAWDLFVLNVATFNGVVCFKWGSFWRRKWQPTPVFLPGISHGQRSLVGYSPCGRKELDMTEWLHFHFFIFLLKFSFLCFRGLVTYHPIATVHDHENGERLGVELWPRTHI